MPILIMALLALIIFGLVGIMFAVAVIMEHSTSDPHPARRGASHPVTSGVAPPPNPKFDRPRSEGAPTENQFEKEKVDEHACVG
jgi:hypothetical protein